MQPYYQVFYRPGIAPTFCYRSGLMVYEETLTNGVLVSAGWNTAGYPLDVLTNCPTRLPHTAFSEPSAFHLELDGRSLDYDLHFVDFVTEQGKNSLKAVLTLDSGLMAVRIRVCTVLDGTHMMTRYLEIENLEDRSLALSRLAVMSGGMEVMERAQLSDHHDVSRLYSLGYFDDDAWGREGAFAWHDLAPNTTTIDTRFGRERFRHPSLFLRNNLTGVMFFSQIGWSGGCRYTVDLAAVSERQKSRLSFSAEITGYKPLRTLMAREVMTTPEVHMGAISGGLDEAVNEMHAHIRRSVLNAPELDPRACYVGAGMGAEHDMSVETTKAFMRQFSEMGAEVFIIDAGWQCPPTESIDWHGHNGHNQPNPDRYPNGMSELSDYCHELGMKFALWVEIERIGRLAEPFHAHPEWRACNHYGIQNDGFLDFTNPEVAKWAEESLARIITEYRLDLLRVDYNVAAPSYFALRDMGSGIKECLSMRHFEAVYTMYRNLKRRFPHVIFENCAGGGGRTDLGIMKAFHHTWVSDWQKMPRSAAITNGMTMVLPPERVDRLFAGMGCHAYGSLDSHMRNTMLTHMSLNVISPAAASWNPEVMAFVRHSVELYKGFIRPFLSDAKVYHHTPEIPTTLQEGYSVLEIASPDGRKGAIAAFTLSGAQAERYTVIPRGLSVESNYRVTLDNTRTSFIASGYELMTAGIPIRIPASLSSELILYETINE